jgi:hypothetical protein
VWGALRELLGREDVKISGRLILDENKAGQRVLKVRSVKPVRKSGRCRRSLWMRRCPISRYCVRSFRK